MKKCVAAQTTKATIYPAYINISEIDHGNVELVVRGDAKADGSCGDTVTATMTASEFCALIGSLVLGKVI